MTMTTIILTAVALALLIALAIYLKGNRRGRPKRDNQSPVIYEDE
jgi:hypothetical protein